MRMRRIFPRARTSSFGTARIACRAACWNYSKAAQTGPMTRRDKRKEPQMAKNTICIWYDRDAEAAARFYAATFPDSAVGTLSRAPSDYPSGKAGDVITVEFTVAGVPCLGLNGGPMFKHSEAFSFQISTDDQEETDRYWNAIVGNGGEERACGWCKEKWGIH